MINVSSYNICPINNYHDQMQYGGYADPECCGKSQEDLKQVWRRYMKLGDGDVTKEYMEKECNPKDFPKESNLSREAQEGIKELKVMTKGDKIVTKTVKYEKLSPNTLKSYKKELKVMTKGDKIVTKTVKYEKLSPNTLKSYKKMGEPHAAKDKTVNPKEVSDDGDGDGDGDDDSFESYSVVKYI